MWLLTRRYLVTSGSLAMAELVLMLVLRREVVPLAVAALLLFAAWTVVPLVFLGLTALYGYDLVAHARRARRDAAQRHVT